MTWRLVLVLVAQLDVGSTTLSRTTNTCTTNFSIYLNL